MKLINDNNGSVMIVGKKYPLVKGKNKGKSVKISEIIEPCDAKPNGLIITDREGVSTQSWQQYFPDVLGAHFEADDAVEVEALPVPVVPGVSGALDALLSVKENTLQPMTKEQVLKEYNQPAKQVELSIPPENFGNREVRA